MKKKVSKFLLAYKFRMIFKECGNNIKKNSFQVIEEPTFNPTYAWVFFVGALEGTQKFMWRRSYTISQSTLRLYSQIWRNQRNK